MIGSAGVETGAFAGSMLLAAAGVAGVTGLFTGISFVVGADTTGAGATGAADFGCGGFPPRGAADKGGRVCDGELLLDVT